uniref:Glucagon / GIP / secretin / VIP family domain-containing protein n=1 Tax=Sphaeramia orbicularis TaxID=375764 RepID=A0A672ZW26_9TELE
MLSKINSFVFLFVLLTGDLRMSLLIWCVLVLFVCSSSKEMVLDKNRPGRHFIHNLKRHSDGTFTSDFTTNRDKIKAKDFVEWLASIKRNG